MREFGGGGGDSQYRTKEHFVVLQFLAKKNIHVITYPPHFPHLDPTDFWLFLTQKIGSGGHVLQPW
jgi:hypothetical protein